jgi:hypothetical protein
MAQLAKKVFKNYYSIFEYPSWLMCYCEYWNHQNYESVYLYFAYHCYPDIEIKNKDLIAFRKKVEEGIALATDTQQTWLTFMCDTHIGIVPFIDVSTSSKKVLDHVKEVIQSEYIKSTSKKYQDFTPKDIAYYYLVQHSLEDCPINEIKICFDSIDHKMINILRIVHKYARNMNINNKKVIDANKALLERLSYIKACHKMAWRCLIGHILYQNGLSLGVYEDYVPSPMEADLLNRIT